MFPLNQLNRHYFLPEQQVIVLYRHWDLVQCSSFEITVWVQKGSSDVLFCATRMCI